MQREATLTFDVFSIILKHVYPQTALNIFLSCKSLARYSNDINLYWFWLEKFLPTEEYTNLWKINHERALSLQEVRGVFVTEWKKGHHLELYDAEAVYDMERIVAMRFVRDERSKRCVSVLSRFPSSTAIKINKLIRPSSGEICGAGFGDPVLSSQSYDVTRDCFLDALKKIRKAQTMLKDKVWYYNITLDLSRIYLHNVTLLMPLKLVGKAGVVYDVGCSFSRLAVEVGCWNEVLLCDGNGSGEYQFVAAKPPAVVVAEETAVSEETEIKQLQVGTPEHQCNCEFCPISRFLLSKSSGK